VLDSSCGTAVQSGLKAEGKNDGSLTPLQFLGGCFGVTEYWASY